MTSPENQSYSRGRAVACGLLVDLSEEAKEVGLTYPVAVTAALARYLRPSEYLSSLGVSFEERVKTLLAIIREALEPKGSGDTASAEGEKLMVNFIVARGPLIKEERIAVVAEVHGGDDGEPVMTLMRAGLDHEAA